MENVGIFFDNWAYFTAIGNILWSFGIFFTVLVFCTKKNLATLLQSVITKFFATFQDIGIYFCRQFRKHFLFGL
jgi:hypothetical protein